MATSAKHCFSVFFLLFLFSVSQVKARESKFFSKITHKNVVQTSVPQTKPPAELSPAKDAVLSPTPAPETVVMEPSPAPSSVPDERDNGYGLYGHGVGYNEQYTSKKEVPSTTGVENELLSEEFTKDEWSENEEDDENESEDDQRGQSGKYFSTGPVTKNYRYGTNGYDQIKPSEQQGMSDTRFLENGKYYHHVSNENSNNKDNYNYNYNNNNNNNNNYNGYDQTAEKDPRYVFDTMEEYEKYQESRGYVP
ncbi:protein E6 [Humulus lupulus]|uniref:protein E6 n=1 Tax=Humulus lupulus TaxID=3486 RepID=UPI002B4066D9|nr:protein E6 [Humulus lupulus]